MEWALYILIGLNLLFSALILFHMIEIKSFLEIINIKLHDSSRQSSQINAGIQSGDIVS